MVQSCSYFLLFTFYRPRCKRFPHTFTLINVSTKLGDRYRRPTFDGLRPLDLLIQLSRIYAGDVEKLFFV